jgi:hypothetical protein
MLTYQNYIAFINSPSNYLIRKILTIRNSKKPIPLYPPANKSFPYYFPTPMAPNLPSLYPPIMEPPKPVYPKFN